MSTTSLATLVTPLSAFQLRQRVLNGLSAKGLPIGDWTPTNVGGLENGVIDMACGALAALGSQQLANAIAMGFLDLASGDGLAFHALHMYGLRRVEATKTVQAITLKCSAQAGPYKVDPGDLVVVADTTGNAYRNIDGGVILPGMGQPTDGAVAATSLLPMLGLVPDVINSFAPVAVAPLVLRFEAEAGGAAYNDAPGTINTLVTSLPGVTAQNARVLRPSPAALIVGGASRGNIVPSSSPPGPSYDRYRIRVVASGEPYLPQPGESMAQFQISVDEGRTWGATFVPGLSAVPLPPELAATVAALGAVCLPDGLVLSFSPAPASRPSFVAGDVFFFANDSILAQGSDAESDDRLRKRCKLMWTTLSDVPTVGTFEAWAKQASPEVQRTRAELDKNMANRALLYIASSLGRCSAATMIAVQAYISDRMDVGESVNVVSVDVRPISVTGTVQVPRTKIADVQAAAAKAWTAYLGSVDIGGTVRLAELEQAIMDAGAIDVTGLAITGGSPNVVLASHEVPALPDGATLASQLSWEAS